MYMQVLLHRNKPVGYCVARVPHLLGGNAASFGWSRFEIDKMPPIDSGIHDQETLLGASAAHPYRAAHSSASGLGALIEAYRQRSVPTVQFAQRDLSDSAAFQAAARTQVSYS